jgi:hypothetical protein
LPSCGCWKKNSEKFGKRKKVASKKRKNRKIKKSHQGPEEVRKPRSPWRKALFVA